MNPAPLQRRFLALGIDGLLIVTYAAVLLAGMLAAYHVWAHHVPDLFALYGPWGAHALGFVALTLPVGIYFIATELSSSHASIGKRLMRIHVVTVRKGRLSARQTVLRTVVKLLPWELAHTAIYWLVDATRRHSQPSFATQGLLLLANVLPIIYVAWVVVRRDHRGPHDFAAQTAVVTD